MEVEGIANIPKNLEDPLSVRTQDQPAAARILISGNAVNPGIREDTFTRSTQNNSDGATAQDTGIFRLSQNAATAVTPTTVFTAQIGGLNKGTVAAQDAPVSAETGVAPQAVGTPSPDAPAVYGRPGTAAPKSPATASSAAADVQVQLQALNAALPALGLTNAQIQQIDHIAALVHNFNPAAYANLVNQFEAQAQQSVQQGATNSPAGAAAARTFPNGATFAVQDIVIHFTRSQGTLNNAAAVGGGQATDENNTQNPAANLQIEQVQFRFVNGDGQTFQVGTPQQQPPATNTNPQSPQRQIYIA
jgi:hypothetical protein